MSETIIWCQDKTRLAICDKQVFTIKEYVKIWYLNGKLHRENGPAVEWSHGEKWWYLNGERHRENGPAVECVNGIKLRYLNGKFYDESDYWNRVKGLNK